MNFEINILSICLIVFILIFLLVIIRFFPKRKSQRDCTMTILSPHNVSGLIRFCMKNKIRMSYNSLPDDSEYRSMFLLEKNGSRIKTLLN